MPDILTPFSFPVTDVTPATTPLPAVSCKEAITQYLNSPVEACATNKESLVANVSSHPLIAALHAAFSSHYPISLSPDIIWLTITQGLAIHINEYAETLRHQFVSHKDKLNIRVRRDGFVKGSPHNHWPGVFSEFSEAIKAHIGSAHALIVADFTTTGLIEKAASEVVLMDAMQSYFTFEVYTLCGIPSISLEGQPDDWRRIHDRVTRFKDFGLDWWVSALLPILKQFEETAEGRIDQNFWESMYKINGPMGSGSPYISGWINALFPYLRDIKFSQGFSWGFKRNEWVAVQHAHEGPSRGDFPNSPSKAPFKWIFQEEPAEISFAMEFIGGLIGVSQCQETFTLRPEIGWAIREAQELVLAIEGLSARMDSELL